LYFESGAGTELHAIKHLWHYHEGMTMAKRSHLKHLAFLTALFLPLGATALVSNTASAQLLQEKQQRQQHAQIIHRAATRINPPINPPERTNTTPDTPTVAPPSSAADKTSALGQALAACNQDSVVQEAFTLPGLKGEITLDRCYKGRAHLICVFTALSNEAKSLTSSYTKIVDAKYPDLTTVDDVCKIKLEALATDITGSEDFARRFKELKSQYEAATRCAANVQQAFKDVSLADLAKAPEVLQSMTASLDGDIGKISKVQERISDLSAKMELSNRAMKAVTKIHHAVCMSANAAGMPGN
jgi:hypothetical protein